MGKIKIKVSDLMGKYKLNKKQVSDQTGIRAGTVTAYYDETIKRIHIDHLLALAKLFEIKDISELIEYIADE